MNVRASPFGPVGHCAHVNVLACRCARRAVFTAFRFIFCSVFCLALPSFIVLLAHFLHNLSPAPFVAYWFSATSTSVFKKFKHPAHLIWYLSWTFFFQRTESCLDFVAVAAAAHLSHVLVRTNHRAQPSRSGAPAFVNSAQSSHVVHQFTLVSFMASVHSRRKLAFSRF